MVVMSQTQLLKPLKETQANNPNKDLTAGLQMVLDTHIQLGQMMSQYITSTGNPQALKVNDSEKSEEEMDTSLKACKARGEIGHIVNECPDEWPHGDANIPTEEYPTLVTCFLCEGNRSEERRVGKECRL